MPFKTIERSTFYLLLAANLIPLWSVHYFLTGDGPCHLHNAHVLLDFWRGGELKDFFNPWMYVNTNFMPNWFGHAFMELFMGMGFAPYLAEKLLQTFYVLSFGFGLRYLVRQLNPNSLFISTFGLLLTYHHVFQMGFYNYSCSVAIMFWVTGFWLQYRNAWTTGRMMALAMGFLALYFCHPIGLLFSFLVIISVFFTEFIGSFLQKDRPVALWKSFWQNGFAVAIAALPVLVLFAQYLFIKGLDPSPRGESDNQIWKELREFTALVNVMNTERPWATGVAVIFALLLLAAIIFKFKIRQLRWTDILLPVTAIAVLIYFKQPGGIAGAGILPIRLQFLPYLMLLLWLASVSYPKWLQAATLVVTAVVFVGFWSIRLPSHQRASAAAVEYASCASVIPDKVSVLPISFDHNGQDANGQEVANRVWLFMHAGDYIGAERSVVMLGNYEAATQNFPLIWRWERNPIDRLKKNDKMFEDQPPIADFLNYPKNSNNGSVDYVVTWCMDRKFADHPNTADIKQQLSEGYDLVFTSQTGLAKVFKRKGL